jgi:glucose/arabinose dehydrogenase
MSPASLRRLALLALATLAAACAGEEPERDAPPSTSPPPETDTAPAQTTTEAEPLRLRLERVASGLAGPLHLASTPSEPERLYVAEREGRIRVLEDERLLPEPFLDIAELVRSGGEQGLLSVAFHPDYERNGLFYVDYTDLNGDTRVVEYEVGARGRPAERRELLFVEQPYPNHNGGQLAFGPDGLLYVGMGDGGAGGDPENRAQDLGSRLGKLLVLDVDDRSADWRIVGYGLRNPWRFSFDRETGDLWIGDVGQNEWEEIDHTPRESPGLENYGWDVFEGSHPYEDKEPNSRGRLVEPVAEYDHSEGCSVTGGFVYRGEAIPAAQGLYIYGDFCSGRVWSLEPRGDRRPRVERQPFDVDGLSSFGEDVAGELYLVSLEGEIFRLTER